MSDFRSGNYTELSPEVLQWLQQFAAQNAGGPQAPAPPTQNTTVQTPFAYQMPQPQQAAPPAAAAVPSAFDQAAALQKRNQALGGGR